MPQDASENLSRSCPKTPQKISPDAHQGGPESDTGAWAHESYSLGVGLHVRRRRTTTLGANRHASSSPLKAADQPLARGPGPTSHTPWASVSECEEGEPPREERTAAPLHLRRKQQTSLWHGGPGPRVILLGRRFLGAEKSNRRSRQYRVSLSPPQKTEKVNFQNQCSGIKAPRAWPGETIKCEGHGSASRWDRRGSWRDRRRTGSDYVSKRTEAARQSPIKLWPHLQARILP
jgi:hypothetical protein